MTGRGKLRILSIGVVLACSSAPSRAVTDEELFRAFRFNLINPGARSLALGGAFLSLADDATAALANPSGLAFLNRWEVFAELRAIDSGVQSTVLTDQIGGTDSIVATGVDVGDLVRPSFVSGVLTFDQGVRWTLGLSRQELLTIDNATVSSFRFTFADTPGIFVAEGDGFIDLQVVNWNASAGFRIGDSFGVGATVTLSTLDIRSQVVNSVLDTGAALAPDPILEPTLDLRTVTDDSDHDLVFGLGLVYQRPRWAAGAVFRQGPDFAVQEQILLTAPGSTTETATDVFDVQQTLGSRVENRFGLPDVVGVGGHWRPLSRLTLAVNVERILYSNLIDGFVAGVNVLTDFDAEFEIDDGTDYRFGGEYIVVPRRMSPIAIRGGAYLESDSTIRAKSTGTNGLAGPQSFAGGDDQWHGTVGLGFVLPWAKLDLAADFSETDNQYVLSFIYQGARK